MKNFQKLSFIYITIMLTMVVYASYAKNVDQSDLVIYYSFDADTLVEGDIIDLSVSGNDGLLQGQNLNIVPGQVNECLEFPGDAANYIAVRNLFYETAIPALSIAVWIKTPQRGLIASWDRSEFFRFAAGDDQLGNTTFVAFDNCCQPLSDWHGSVEVTDDEWHHVVVTFNEDWKRIYVDGELDTEAVPAQSVIGPKLTRYGFIGIGSEAEEFNGTKGPTNFAFKGLMDEFLMFHRVLSAEEVERIATATGNPFAIDPKEKLSTTWAILKNSIE